MRLYFLVEGKRTERKIYPKWLGVLAPQLTRVYRVNDETENSYVLVSAEGYPSIIQDHLPNAIKDVNDKMLYDFLVLCLDADEYSVEQRIAEVQTVMSDRQLSLRRGHLKIIVQNRCIETWFLGNPRVVARTPTGEHLRAYKEFFDVSRDDPEHMGVFPGFSTHAQFHSAYLSEIFRERNLTYTKTNPGHAGDPSYLGELISRTKQSEGVLSSLSNFLSFCSNISGSAQK